MRYKYERYDTDDTMHKMILCKKKDGIYLEWDRLREKQERNGSERQSR